MYTALSYEAAMPYDELLKPSFLFPILKLFLISTDREKLFPQLQHFSKYS